MCALTALGCACCTLPRLRWSVGRKYQIYSPSDGTCKGVTQATLAALCCPWCSLCQTYHELSIHGAWPGGTAPCEACTPMCVPAPQAADLFAGVGYGAYR